jgi:enediyne biosynthesis protein E4
MRWPVSILTFGSLLVLAGAAFEAASRNEAGIVFEDATAGAGIAFQVRNGASGSKFLIETMIAGVAVFDYNSDGRPDIYLVNGGSLPGLDKPDASFENRLYRNDGNGKFSDVTAEAGVAGRGYGMGVAAADYDNDGFPDLFVSGVNHDILYRNRGDGTFEDVTAKVGLANRKTAGVAGKPWSVDAAWLDYDNDGLLDLFVVNYVQWDPAREPFCGDREKGYRTYCHPKHYLGLPNSLYKNNGDGTFTDVSEASGIAKHIGKGMGVAIGDFNRDGRIDIVVGNDTVPNFLFRNESNGQFTEVAMEAGVAFNDDGRALSSMGVDFRDYDNDGLPDLFITALANETFPLFRNMDKRFFEDVTYRAGVGMATLPFSGWSNAILDFDNDGWKDLFVAAGDVQDNTEVFSSRQSRQPNRILRNRGGASFVDVSERAGKAFQAVALHRGAAFGDFEGDGRLDAIVTSLDKPAVLFRNATPGAGNWIGFRLTGTTSNRDGIGAEIRIVGASGAEQWNSMTTSVGYGGSSEAVVHFGLGADISLKTVEIRWPGGVVQTLEEVEANRYLTVKEPAGS